MNISSDDSLPSFLLARRRTGLPLSVLLCYIPSFQNGNFQDSRFHPCSLKVGQHYQEKTLSLAPGPADQGTTPTSIGSQLRGANEEGSPDVTESKEATGHPLAQHQCLSAHPLAGGIQGDLESHGHQSIARRSHTICLDLAPHPLGHNLCSPCHKSCGHYWCYHSDLCGPLAHSC